MSRSAHSRSFAPSAELAETDLNMVNFMDSDISNISIESFKYDRTLAAKAYVYLVKDPEWSFRIGVLRICIKILSCILYVVGRILEDRRRHDPICTDFSQAEHCEFFCPTVDNSPYNCSTWSNILFVHRTEGLWIAQLVVGVACMLETSIYLYIGAVFSHWRVYRVVSRYHILDFLTGIPFLLGIFDETLQHLFVPVFLNVWSAKFILTVLLSGVYKALHQEESQLSHKAFVLGSTIIAILFTSTCFIHHLQRIDQPWNMFESFWFVIVTITTVGYGDYSPARWPGQLYVIFMILVSLYTLPAQIEEFTTILRGQRVYGTPPKKGSSHVVVVGKLSPQDLHDLLSEIYAYHRLQSMTVVILSPSEPNSDLQMLLNIPLYRRRVVYLYGSALNSADLERAQMSTASACFILGNRRSTEYKEEDQRTIIRCWAVRDFAPRVRMFVQLFDRRNKFQVNFAEHVMCLDEIKNALLATSCVCPGASTFLTLLLHTSRVKEGEETAPWHYEYGQCSANEIYDITLSDSSLFSRFAGKNFLFAATWVFRKSGYLLIGVRPFDGKDTLLNPGREYILRPSDKLFYIGASREENATVSVPPPRVRPALRAMCATIAAANLHFIQMYGRFEGRCHKDELELQKQLTRLKCFARGSSQLKFFNPAPKLRHGSNNSLVNGGTRRVSTDTLDVGVLSRGSALDFGNPPSPLTIISENVSPAHPPGRDFLGVDAVEIMREMRNISSSDTPPHLGVPHRSLPTRLRQALNRQDSTMSTSSREEGKHLLVPNKTSDDHMGSSHYAQRRYLAQKRVSAVIAQRNEDILGLAPPLGLEDLNEEVGPGKPLTEAEQDELEQLETGEEAFIEEEDSEGRSEDVMRRSCPWVSQERYVIAEPRHVPYMQGKHRLHCHLLSEDKPLCCLELNKSCSHQDRSVPSACQFMGAIIVGCAEADVSLFTFVVTLRAHYIAADSLLSIILLLKERPSESFLRYFAGFPRFAFLVGQYSKLDDLLLAGILVAKAVIVLGSRKDTEEIFMVDAQTVVGVQKLYRFFPNSNIITLLSHRSNMRFLNTKCLHRFHQVLDNMNVTDGGFAPQRHITSKQTTGDHLHYMFQPQFAAGDVFTSSMLDTLLYQTYVKPWLLDLVRQLIGAKQNEKHQCSMSMVDVTAKMAEMETYGRLLLHLSFKTGDLVIGLYRTLPPRSPEILACQMTWMNDVSRIVGNRMSALGIPGTAPVLEPRGQSYVLINPPQSTEIKKGDKLYVIRHVPSEHVGNTTPPGTPDHSQSAYLAPDPAVISEALKASSHHHHHHYHYHHPEQQSEHVRHHSSLQTVAEVHGSQSAPRDNNFADRQSAVVDMSSVSSPKIFVSSVSLCEQESHVEEGRRPASELGTRRRAARASRTANGDGRTVEFSFLDRPTPSPTTVEAGGYGQQRGAEPALDPCESMV